MYLTLTKILARQHRGLELLSLILLWGIIQALSAVLFDMRQSVDTRLYLESAEQLLVGKLPAGRAIFYSSYSGLIAVLYKLGLEAKNIIYLQFISGIVALVCIYKLSTYLTTNRFAPFLASLLYVLWFKFQQWNLIIYTDAMFAHFIIISVYALVVAKSRTSNVITSLLIVFTTFLRPTGVGLLFAISVYGAYGFFKRRNLNTRSKILLWSIGGILLLFALNFAIKNYIEMFFDGYKTAEIIYPNITLFIAQPQNQEIPVKAYPPLLRLILFVLYNPVYLFKTALLKGLLFVAHVKPYYSLAHNIFIAAFLYPAYYFAAKGLKYLRHSGVKALFISFMGFQFITVCLTSENWDGRFLLPVLPLVFILAAIGFTAMWGKKHT